MAGSPHSDIMSILSERIRSHNININVDPAAMSTMLLTTHYNIMAMAAPSVNFPVILTHNNIVANNCTVRSAKECMFTRHWWISFVALWLALMCQDSSFLEINVTTQTNLSHKTKHLTTWRDKQQNRNSASSNLSLKYKIIEISSYNQAVTHGSFFSMIHQY